MIGQPTLMRSVADDAGKMMDPLIFVGGFPRGHFSDETRRILNSVFKIDRQSLDAWVVAGRFVYDFEWAIGVAQERLKIKNDKP
jgi:rRNA pseudouridine-1189 N-methylase Emg1 (Nep1/Mra1 family)